MRVIDLTTSLDNKTTGFHRKLTKRYEVEGWNSSDLNIYSHAGTHMDAPFHFNAGPETIDKIAVERFICNCYVIHINNCTPSHMITTDYVKHLDKKIKDGEGIIIHTGWAKYKDDPDSFRNKAPRISKELAEWIVSKNLNMVGVEPPSIADVNNLEELRIVHKTLLNKNILILEGLCNLDNLKKDFVRIIALPLKIADGDGAPARVIAIEED